MKITKSQLKQIIKEEISKILKENEGYANSDVIYELISWIFTDRAGKTFRFNIEDLDKTTEVTIEDEDLEKAREVVENNLRKLTFDDIDDIDNKTLYDIWGGWHTTEIEDTTSFVNGALLDTNAGKYLRIKMPTGKWDLNQYMRDSSLDSPPVDPNYPKDTDEPPLASRIRARGVKMGGNW